MNRTIAILRAGAALALLTVQSVAAQQQRPLISVTGDPNHWETYFDHGIKVMKVSAPEAELAFAWASQLDPTRAEPLFARYATKFILMQPEKTVSYLRGEPDALRDPAVQSADSARSMALLRNGFVHRGLEAVMIDRLPGEFDDSRDVRAWLAYSNGELPRAVDLYTRSIRRRGDRARWEYFDRALAYAAVGDSRAALADLRTLLEILRKDDDTGTITFYRSKHFLLHMIGSAQLSTRDLEGAKTSFQEALVEDASFAYAHVGLAHVARAQQRHAEATDALTLAIELAPQDGTIWNFRAASRYSQSQFEDAFADASRAATLLPQWSAPVFAMAQARERQGRRDEARTLYTRYIAMAPANDPQARAVRQRLGIGAP